MHTEKVVNLTNYMCIYIGLESPELGVSFLCRMYLLAVPILYPLFLTHHRSTSPFQEPQQASQAEQLEAEILALHSKIHELESRLAHLGGHEDFAVELTVQLSSYQQELEDKSRKLATVQHKSQSSLSPPPPSYTGTGSSASRMPDIDSLSLEDAQWFQAGLPRFVE